MAELARLSTEDYLGLGIAAALHVGLAAFLVTRGTAVPDYVPPERIDVSLATEVSLESTAPDPSAEPAAAYAPVIDELPQPEQQVVEEVVTPPVSEPVRRPVTQPRPQPTPRATQTPTPRPTTAPTRRATPTPTPTATRSQAATGSRIGSDFLEGSSASEGRSGSPAATFGPTERAALASAITRALRPNWTAPSGVDADKLVTVVAWELNRDGTLRGQPRCVSQRGITPSNQPQADLHCERAKRAVQLANFSSLPEQFYSRWDDLEWEFDRRL